MKVLLDENLPHQLRLELPGHDVFTVAFMEWGGIENGELLRVATAQAFDVLITNDHGIEYEQNVHSLPLAVVVLLAKSNTMDAIRTLLPDLLAVLRSLRPCQFIKLRSP